MLRRLQVLQLLQHFRVCKLVVSFHQLLLVKILWLHLSHVKLLLVLLLLLRDFVVLLVQDLQLAGKARLIFLAEFIKNFLLRYLV